MSKRIGLSLVFTALVLVAATPGIAQTGSAPKGPLPNVVVLATGGTIAGAAASDVQAGYTSGQVGVDQLLAAVPQAKKLANLRGEQISNIGSQDMNDEVWLKLARRINELTAMKDVDGVVITHGTDTIEETAYFLNLVVKSRKPVVLTASMRPSTALSADGPLNFYNAVAVAANKDAAGRGVLVVINDWIHGASSLTKTSTTAVQTFMSPLRGLVGVVAYGDAEWFRGPVGKHTMDSEFSLDKVIVPAARGHHHGLREHGRGPDRRRGRGRSEGHRDRGRRQRQHDGRRVESPRCAGEEGHHLRALLAGHDGERGPQRGGGRRQDGIRRVARSEPAEVAGPPAAGADPDEGPQADSALFRPVLRTTATDLRVMAGERRRKESR